MILNTQVKNAKGKLAQMDEDKRKKIKPPTVPTFDPPTGTVPTSGGSAGAGAGRESQVPQLQRERDLAKQLEPLYGRIAEAKLRGDKETVIRLQGQQALFELTKKEADIQASKIPDAEKQLQLELLAFERRKKVLDTTYELKELEQKRKEALEGVTRSIEDEIELLQAKLNGNEKEIKQLQDIEKLAKSIAAARTGNPNAKASTEDFSKASGLVTERDSLKERVNEADKLKQAYSSLASGIAGEFTNAFKSIIDGSKDVNEAFADMLQGIADQFLNMAMKILQDAITQQLMQLFTGLLGGGAGAGGFSGAPQLSGIPFSAGGIGYEGGGYTGDAPRSGGLDGKGGFLSVLHPQETVVDHYGDAADAMTSAAGNSAAFSESNEAMTMATATRSANTAAAADALQAAWLELQQTPGAQPHVVRLDTQVKSMQIECCRPLIKLQCGLGKQSAQTGTSRRSTESSSNMPGSQGHVQWSEMKRTFNWTVSTSGRSG